MSSDRSTAEVPSSTTPSVATFSPGRTTNRSPTDEGLDRHLHLDPVAEHGDLLGAELHQRAQGVAGAPLAAGLGPPAEEEERRDHRGGLGVEVAVARDHRDRRPEPGGRRPERDQRVHRGGEVAGVEGGGAVERPAGPPDHDAGERERPPLVRRGAGRRHHRPQHHRHGEDRGHEQPARAASRWPRGRRRGARRRTPPSGRPRPGRRSRGSAGSSRGPARWRS